MPVKEEERRYTCLYIRRVCAGGGVVAGCKYTTVCTCH